MAEAAISPYVVAKHALAGFTKAVALEDGEMGMTCNAICPGAVETDLPSMTKCHLITTKS